MTRPSNSKNYIRQRSPQQDNERTLLVLLVARSAGIAIFLAAVVAAGVWAGWECQP